MRKMKIKKVDHQVNLFNCFTLKYQNKSRYARGNKRGNHFFLDQWWMWFSHWRNRWWDWDVARDKKKRVRADAGNDNQNKAKANKQIKHKCGLVVMVSAEVEYVCTCTSMCVCLHVHRYLKSKSSVTNVFKSKVGVDFCLLGYLLGIPETNFKGLKTLIALKVLKSISEFILSSGSRAINLKQRVGYIWTKH